MTRLTISVIRLNVSYIIFFKESAIAVLFSKMYTWWFVRMLIIMNTYMYRSGRNLRKQCGNFYLTAVVTYTYRATCNK